MPRFRFGKNQSTLAEIAFQPVELLVRQRLELFADRSVKKQRLFLRLLRAEVERAAEFKVEAASVPFSNKVP
jgi:hypothetical protein